jgi:hypothetical protein
MFAVFTTSARREYLDGETFAVALRGGPLPLPLSLKVGVEIADALDKVHHEGTSIVI